MIPGIAAYLMANRLRIPHAIPARIDWFRKRALAHRAAARRLTALRRRALALRQEKIAQMLEAEASRLARGGEAGHFKRITPFTRLAKRGAPPPEEASDGSSFQPSTPADVAEGTAAAATTDPAAMTLTPDVPFYKNPVVIGVAALGAILIYTQRKKGNKNKQHAVGA